MIKKILLLLSLAFTFFLPLSASAHVLAQSGSIEVMMHMNPDDQPVSGTATAFLFNFDDAQKKFDLADCNCQAEIIDGDTPLFLTTLTTNSGDHDLFTGIFSYTFSKRGLYTVKLRGEPKDGAAFSPFTTSFDIRVEGAGMPMSEHHTDHMDHMTHDTTGWWLAIVLAVGIVTYVLTRFISIRVERKKKVSASKTLLGVAALLIIGASLFHQLGLLCTDSLMQMNDHQCCFVLATVPTVVNSAELPPEAVSPTDVILTLPLSHSLISRVNNKSPPVIG